MTAEAVSKKVEYPKVLFEKPFMIDGISYLGSTGNDQMLGVVLDGYSDEIDPQLSTVIHNTMTHDFPFVVDCFKMVTRNIGKLLRIMEFLLTNDRAFVTSNYYIENGYIERRVHPIRAAHYHSDVIEHYSQTSGLGYRHARVLKSIYSALKVDDK
jgi:hypothetical protein